MIGPSLDFPSLIASNLIDQADFSIIVYDKNGLLQYTNKNFLNLCRRHHFEVFKSHVRSIPLFYFNEQGSQELFADHPLLADWSVNRESVYANLTLSNANNETFPIRINRSCVIHDEDPYYIFIFMDNRNGEKERDIERLFQQVFVESNEAMAITDITPKILDVNPAFESITGYSKKEVLGKNPSMLASGYHPLHFYEKFWHTLNAEGRWVGKMVNRRKSGEVYSEQITVLACHNEMGKIDKYVSIFSELNKQNRRQNNSNNVDPARIDELTGLPKQQVLIDRLDQAIGYARRHQFKVAIFCIDIDHFELINNTYGNKQGDQVIRAIAQNIQHHIREGDTLSRNSGDEYVLVLRDLAIDFDIEDFSERLLKIINTPIIIKQKDSRPTETQSTTKGVETEILVTASVGISHYPHDTSTAEQLIRHASHAMSLAKSDGRARSVFYSPEYEHQKLLANAAKIALLDAVKNEEMRLHVQPQYNVVTKKLHGIEFLIRWEKDNNELIYPDQFLNSHKDPELLTAVDQWVISKVIELLQNELDFVVDMQLKVGINLTTSSLQNLTFHSWLIANLERLNRRTSRLFEIEILEHDALNNLQALSKLIHELKPLGVTFSLDDFGTGYSSLSIFNQIEVDTVKIDKKFVKEMILDSKNLSLVKAICEMSKIFDRKTIAEGVEFQEQADLLLSSGCHIMQGYSIAKPMSTHLFKAWVDKQGYDTTPSINTKTDKNR